MQLVGRSSAGARISRGHLERAGKRKISKYVGCRKENAVFATVLNSSN